MATVAEVSTALATVVGTVVRCTAYPGQANPPCAFVVLREATYDQAMGKGLDLFVFDLFVFTSTANDRTGYEALTAYAAPTGSTSVRSAVYTDRHIGLGAASNTTARVVDFRVLGTDEVEAFKAFGGVFTIEVHTRGA